MIYFHIPFCHRRCTYCAFYAVAAPRCRQDYVDALCDEVRSRGGTLPAVVRTVYFGGGTPSMLSVEQISQIFSTMGDYCDLSHLEEVTLECNPEDLTDEYLCALRRQAWVSRLSVGVQTFDDAGLHLLNRRHRAADAVAALHRAYDAGFRNIGIDLIYGRPGQTLGQWKDDLGQVEALDGIVTHLSCYALTVESGTMLERQLREHRLHRADDDAVVAQYHSIVEWACRNGFEQYEISNFCRHGLRSCHNSRYWNRTPYWGFGAAAHSFDGKCRRWNTADVRLYIDSTHEGLTDHSQEILTDKDAFNEYIMTSLRTVEGIEKEAVTPAFAAYLSHAVRRPIAQGLIVETPTHYRPTQQGLLMADGITVEMMLD